MMNLLDAYTLGPAHQEVKQTGISPQYVFLVAVTEDLFYFSKHCVRPSSLNGSFDHDRRNGTRAIPVVRRDPIQLFRKGRRIESGRSLFALSENLSKWE